MSASTPKEYFDDAREADLADRVWQLSARLPSHWNLQLTHDWFDTAAWPWMNKRIVWARDWITTKREQDGAGGVLAVNSEFQTDFTAVEIADVEHFYVAALLGTIGGPAGGVMLNILGDTVWEMLVGPTRIAWSYGVKAGFKSISANWKQLTGPDAAGTRFGSFYTIKGGADLPGR